MGSTVTDGSHLQRDEALLTALTSAPQLWLATCRDAVAAGPDATRELFGDRRETRVLARLSRTTWKRPPRRPDGGVDIDALLEEESEQPDTPDLPVGADLSAAHATAAMAGALSAAIDVEDGCATLLAHAERAGLHSVGTQLLPAGTSVTSDSEPLRSVVLHLLGQGSQPARGYGILLALELAGRRPPQLRATHIPVLFATYDSNGRGGEAGTLHLRQVKGGPSGLHPDPARMGFLQADEDFIEGLRQAWATSRLADSDAGVLWSVTVDRGAPANQINGGSMAAAVAVALDDLAPRHPRLRHLRPRRLDPACAVTAGLSGTTLTPVTGYADKITAAQHHSLRVIVADDARDVVVSLTPPEYTSQISSAGTLTDAIHHSRTRTNHKLWAAVLAAALVVASATGTATQFFRMRAEHARTTAEAHSQLYAGLSQVLRDRDPAVAQQLALAAYRTHDTADARSALLDTTATNTPVRITSSTAETQGLTSYIDRFTQMATAPDGDLLATGEKDATVQLSRLTDTGVRSSPRFPTGGGPVLGLAISGDQQWLLVAGQDSSALWDITDPDSPQRTADLSTSGHMPWTAGFSPDSSQFAIGTRDGAILAWHLGTDRHPTPLPPITMAGARDVRIAVGNRALAACETHNRPGQPPLTATIRLWDTTTLALDQRPVYDREVERAGGAVCEAITLSPDGATLAASVQPPEILRWRIGADLTRPEPLGSIPGHGIRILDLTISADNRYLAFVDDDEKTWLWDLERGEESTALADPYPFRARFLRGGRSLAAVGADRSTYIFDIPGPTSRTAQQTIFRLPPDQRGIPPGGQAAALLPLLRPLSPETPPGWRDGDRRLLITIAISPDRTRAATVDEVAGGEVQVWNIAHPAAPTKLGAPINGHTGTYLADVAFTPDGHLVIGTILRQAIELWDVTDDVPARTLTIPYTGGFPISIAVGGGLLAVASAAAHSVTIYDLTGSNPRRLLELDDLDKRGHILTLAMSSRRTLAVATLNQVSIYDLANPDSDRRPVVLTGPGTASVTFDQDGTRLAAAADDGIHIWNVTDPHRPTTYATLTSNAPRATVSAIAFEEGGRRLIQTSLDGTLRTWRTDAAAEAQRICATGTTPITTDEWNDYLPGTRYTAPCPARR
ncbi:hypothetical protein HLB23_11285 [Nocardia uniformis]|uniref:WD40 repeat protein n=1 Tax=Nocardia uniformis TaxID=53432 RepID=A0A849C3T6_9NOCA|nr:hypothetical protein [Nocardia uniformis]NNH70437.1 hypothetical protein [Nocardia uniformis]